MTTKPTERIVVFVTPAQKRAISSTAENLGVSVSELMRRAVMNFDVTSEQVKVAGLVDKLHAPKPVDPLAALLEQVAQRTAMREASDAREAENTARAAVQSTSPAELLPEPAMEPILQSEHEAAVTIKEPQSSREVIESASAREYARQTIYTVTTRMIITTATAAAIPLATAPHAISMKTSFMLQSLSVAKLVRS